MYRITAGDMQAKLLRMMGGSSEQESVSDIRMAIRSAMRLVSAEFVWPYYCDYLHLNTQESYTTGTITYTASTRSVSLSGGTWPSWAGYGSLIIDDLHARVDAVSSTTDLTVIANDAPVDDFTGEFTLYQYQFQINATSNIYKFGKAQVDQANWLDYVNPAMFETDVRKQYLVSGGRPRYFTVSRDFRNSGRQLFSLWPYPTTEMRIRMGYVRHPADILIWSYETGKIALTAADETVTGTDTVFTANMVGCLLRSGSDIVNVPTDADGAFPAVNEAVIASYTSATSLELAEAAATTQAEASVCISSLLDFDYNTMTELVLYKARLELCKIRKMEAQLRQQYEQDYAQALYAAKCQASVSDSVRVAGAFANRSWNFSGQFDSFYTLG